MTRIEKIARLLAVLRDSGPMHAKEIALQAELDHAATLRWLYALHAQGLVESYSTNPRKWRWKKQ